VNPSDKGPSPAPAGKPPSLETVAKGIAATVVGCYIAGLLTVSGYLYRSGVSFSDPSALKARFVYTGAVVLLIVVASVGFFLVGLGIGRGRPVRPRIQFSQARTKASPSRSLGARQLAVATAVSLLPCLALVAVLRWVGGMSFVNVSLYSHALFMWAWAVGGGVAAVAALTALFGTAPEEVERKVPRWTAVLALSTYGLVFLVVLTTIVSSYLYPLIPEQFGGGRPRSVHLVLSREGARLAPRLGILPSGSPSVSSKVSLIWEDGDYLAVRTRQREIVQLNKALVLAAQPD
jgi:hypothetical protein